MRRTFAAGQADASSISQHHGKSLRSVKGQATSNPFFRSQVRQQNQHVRNNFTAAAPVGQMAEIPSKRNFLN